METKTCKNCGRELPIAEFLPTRWGTYSSNCKKCIFDKKRYTRSRKVIGGGLSRTHLTPTPILTASSPWRCYNL